MSEMSERFQRAHIRAHNDWQRNFVIPYSNAYSTAWENFKKTLEDQEKADAEQRAKAIGFAMFALSLCGGSVLTAVFGQAAVKAAASEIALDAICKREMERAFKVAAFVSENKTASFALGEVWDKTGELISDKVKSSLAETSANFPSLGEFATRPLNMRNNLDKWVRDAYAKLLLAEEDIFGRTKDAIRQDGLFVELMKAPFFRLTPPEALKEDAVSTEIEIVFFMKHMLDLDYVAHGYWEDRPKGGMRQKITSTAPINVDPLSDKYPTYKGPRDLSMRFEEVRYRDAGDLIKARVDALIKKRFGVNFFRIDEGIIFDSKEKVSLDVLKRAQTKLQSLATSNYETIARTLPH
jgi:hypothetical protein